MASMTRDEITAFLVRRQASFDRHDVTALLRDHAEDSVIESPMAGSVEGLMALEPVYRTWFTAFPDLTLHAEELLIDGDRVALVAVLNGTDTGGFMGFAPSGRAMQIPTLFLYTLKDGKIARLRTIYDFTGLLVQLGALKAKPA